MTFFENYILYRKTLVEKDDSFCFTLYTNLLIKFGSFSNSFIRFAHNALANPFFIEGFSSKKRS